jgi:thioredoxin-like negative regulator of GroEL
MTLAQLARLVLAFLAVLASRQEARAADGLLWYTDLKLASAAARDTDRPILIDFWADWCAPCLEMDRDVYTDPRVIEVLRRKVVVVRVHFDAQKEMVRKFNVETLPDLVFANSYGTPLLYHHGYLSAGDLAKVVEALPSITGINVLDRTLQENKNDAAALLAMARTLRTAGFYESSITYYRRASASAAVKTDAGTAESVLYDMASNYLELRNGKQAAGMLEKCLKEFPRSTRKPEILLALGRAYTLTGLNEKARRSLSAIVRDYPESPAAGQARLLLKTP